LLIYFLTLKHVYANIFLEGFTINEELNEVYLHLFPSHVFAVSLSTWEEKLLFKFPASQPYRETNYLDQSSKKWKGMVDLSSYFYVMDYNGNYKRTKKLTEGIEKCTNLGATLARDESTGLYYYHCSWFDHKDLRIFDIKENLEESTFVSIWSRFNTTLERVNKMFAERNNLYFYTSDDRKLKGFDIDSGKLVFENRVPMVLWGKIVYFVPSKVEKNSSVKLVKLK
jgi:outer membrane protein assembly factor BamB